MHFDLDFKFPYDGSIPNIDNRIGNINRFLANHVSLDCGYRHFGIEIFRPNFSVSSCNRISVKKFMRNPVHQNHYILGFFCFKITREEVGENTKIQVDEVGNTILLDLGEVLEKSIENDAKSYSAIAATPLESVVFKNTGDHIHVNFKGTARTIFLIDGIKIPDESSKNNS